MLSTVCPNCGATFRLRDELRGRALRCTRCGEVFTAPSTEVAAVMTPVAGASVLPHRAPPVAPRLADEPWSPRRLMVRKVGAQIAVVGVLALILPLFGLQFTKLAKLGDAAWIAGAMLILIGAVMVGLAYAGRRAGLIALVAVPVTILGGIGLILATSLMVQRSGPVAVKVVTPPPGMRSPTPMSPRPSFAAPPTPGGAPAMGSASTRVRTTGPATTQPVGTRGILIRQFGENRVVDVRVIGLTMPSQRSLVQRKLFEAMRRITSSGPSRASFLVPPPPGLNGAAALVVGPVDDPNTLAGAIDFGTATVDAPRRTITITVDPATLTPPTGRRP